MISACSGNSVKGIGEMRISYNWLKDYIDLDYGTEELKRILTFSGIEVEAVEELPALPDSVVSAYVVSAQKIEGSDHLQVCQVDYGQGHCQVVCGAANCHSGMKVVLALPGTKLGDLTIKEAKLRGVLSSGMLCSERELGISDNHDGIIELPPDTPVGSSVNSLYALPDTIFELEITPNRSDLLGYLGIAKDLSASTNKPVKIPQPCLTEEEEPIFRHLSVKVTDSRFCPRYTARLFQDVKIGESPLWLKVKLLKSGLRPINNAVDITNFVMLEAGHPLHAFDYQCVGDRQIIIRPAASQEQISTLDGKTYALDERDLVIADSKHPIAIAGVIGGTNSHITDATKEIVLEAATFNAGLVRKTSYTHKIQTDSAYRFERHLCPEAVVYASNRAAELFTSLCQARLCTGVLDDWQHPEKPVVLGIRPSRFTKLIGYRLSDEKIQQYLSSLGLRFIQYGTWIPGKIENLEQIYCYHTEQMKQGVTEFDEDVNCIHSQYYEIPPNRVDLEREIDLIEELARLHGYDKVPRKLSPQIIMDRHAHKTRRMLADLMVENGFFEIVNYSFDDPDDAQLLGFQNGFKLINPQSSQLSAMRQTLIPQVLKTALYNLNHDERNIKLFEMNKVFISKNADSYLEPYEFICYYLQLR
ncbi:MAG: phenylalanine--tRNA ligase subunit beta [Candidatus Cloacimonetes bacterium]|nr:phenylalanine--tRNA ligase subunit beta [Candidatus Cloacimonadota bacterium]